MVTLTAGSRHAAVPLLQEALNQTGFGDRSADSATVQPLAIDGTFGPKTLRAVRWYQAAHDLNVDGVVGPATWASLARGPARPLIEMWRARLAVAGKAELSQLLCAQPGTPSAVVAVLQAAIADLGAAEDPPGSNRGPQIRHLVDGYAAYWSIPGRPDHLDWCAIAVSQWIRLGLGLPPWDVAPGTAPPLPGHPFGRWFGGVQQLATWADTRPTDRWWRGTRVPAGVIFLTGDVEAVDRRERFSHTGLVVADAGASVRTIEGNTSHSVASLSRRKSSISGYIRWWP